MITVIASETGGALDSVLAENLAVLCRRAGRRVLLVDATPEQACRGWARARAATHLRPLAPVLGLRGMGFGERLAREGALASMRRHDVLVGAGGCDSPECRSALLAAQLAVVPIAVRDADVGAHYRLIARLNAARMFNPDLRVLFVTVADGAQASRADLARVRGYALEVMGGRVAAAVLPAAALQPGSCAVGGCACDDGPAAAGAAFDAFDALDALRREVFGEGRGGRQAPSCEAEKTVQG